MSYYGSSDAGRTYVPAELQDKGASKLSSAGREISFESTTSMSSFSEYSSDSPIDDHPNNYANIGRDPSPSDGKRRRRSIPSEGGSDRRRLAIVQMDSVKEDGLRLKTSSDPGHDGPISDSLRRRRGFPTLKGLALVAPPDASPRTYTYMTPPSSAPITGDDVDIALSKGDGGHQRSQSEVGSVKKKKGLTRGLSQKSSREVGIVGTSRSATGAQYARSTTHEALKPPIFQLPQSRSPSPGAASDRSHSSGLSAVHYTTPVRPSSNKQVIVTPEIGQRKDIGVPVAAPVVISLAPGSSLPAGMKNSVRHPITPDIVVQQMPSPPYSPALNSLYLNYQPGTLPQFRIGNA